MGWDEVPRDTLTALFLSTTTKFCSFLKILIFNNNKRFVS